MRPFAYARAGDLHAALAAAGPGALFIAGGTDLLQLWKTGVVAPDRLIDISRLPLDGIEHRGDAISIGALARMRDVAEHPLIGAGYPAIAEALRASASAQVRNVATIGGNLLQRTRCAYFRHPGMPCNKRQTGSGCGARDGENRSHAIFGASAQCVATHASDLAVALVALDARIRLRGAAGERVLPVEAFFTLPGATPERDTALEPGELIVAVELPGTRARSHYLKLRDRASFEFAVVSVAVALDVVEDVIVHARIAAGGVGAKPWRLPGCEAALAGAKVGPASFAAAAARAADGAQPLSQNGFKCELLRRAVRRALEQVMSHDHD
jgi:xanthine dehydrogenase YagS FAD-binding subunit